VWLPSIRHRDQFERHSFGVNVRSVLQMEDGSADLTLSTRTEGSATVVAAEGEVDLSTIPQLSEQLESLINDGQVDLIIDMAGVNFIDSTGLGVLVGARKKALAKDGSVQLARLQPKVLKIFRITQLTEIFPVYESVADALESVSGHP
jgi:anti-sigma B factor antagonist